MFTGIIEELGTVTFLEPRLAGARLVIQCRTVLADSGSGSSIAVNGVCLTALDLTPDSFAADLAPETLTRTNLGDLSAGARVNLERPVTPATRLSGHIVQGHVDTTAELVALDELGDGNWWLRIRVPPAIDRYIVHKGSIAIDGISLTVNKVADEGFAVNVIPHTAMNTTLQEKRPGDEVNIETDIIGKYLDRLISMKENGAGSGVTLDLLAKNGFL